jgi:hypothetical protein
MKTPFEKTLITIFILSLIFSGFTFETRAGSDVRTDYEQSLTNSLANVPATVMDPNFRWWQPSQLVPLVPANIGDIMMTDGSRIYYNPQIVNQVPLKIQAFFLAHEYGHIYQRTSNEFQADQFAAQVYAQTDMSVVRAAVWHFYNIQGSMCDWSHGCGWQRALNIGQTAGLSRGEIENIIRGNF